MSLKTTGVPFSVRHMANRRGPSEETLKVLKLASEIKSIERATDYIKDNGKAPPSTPNYYLKKLDTY